MSGAAAAHAAILQAIKASGAVVKVSPQEFSRLITKMNDGLVIEKPAGGFFDSSYKYSTSYKGFVFYCKSNRPMSLPGRIEKITAKQIWSPQ